MTYLESDPRIPDLVRVLWLRMTKQYLNDSEKSGGLEYVRATTWTTKGLFFFCLSYTCLTKRLAICVCVCVCVCVLIEEYQGLEYRERSKLSKVAGVEVDNLEFNQEDREDQTSSS